MGRFDLETYCQNKNDRLLEELAEVREILLPYVDKDNSCGDMVACTVSNPYCISCVSKNISNQLNQLNKT